jgi:putative ABC transport system permease protein
VNDRIKDYGTIKAIGGDNKFIAKLIMGQAVLYALIGFSFAMALLCGLRYAMIANNNSMNFSPSLIAFLIIATLVLCVVGSYFSMRKILKLEPVQIFRM